MNLILLYMAVFALTIWLAVRVGKAKGTGWGIACFFIPVLSVIPLIDTWGQSEHDIRVPFFLTLFAYALQLHVWLSIVGDVEQDLQQYYADESYQPVDPQQQRIQLRNAISRAQPKRGLTSLTDVPVSMNIPDQFKLYDRQSSGELLDIALAEVSSSSLVGFFLHQNVDMLGSNVWGVELYWLKDGRITDIELRNYSADQWVNDIDFNLNSRDVYRITGMPMLPVVDNQKKLVTWIEKYRISGERGEFVDCHALRLGKSGTLQFSVIDIPVNKEELCLRSVRLLADSTSFNDGEAWDDAGVFSARAGYDLSDFIVGKN